MNKYFKPLDWEINDYLSYINEPSTIDLSPYLNYIIPEEIKEEESVSHSEVEGGSDKPHTPTLTPKEELPKSKPIDIPTEKGESKLEYTPSEGEKSFENYYIKVIGEKDGYYDFFSKVAKNESGYNPKAKNPNAPAYGYFQFMQDGVRYNNISHYGDVDIETFLNTPEIQINAAKSLADSFLSHLNEEDLAKMAEKGITRSGALGGMWLGGYGGLKRYLYNNENISDKHWSPSGAGIDMEAQIKRYNGLFKKGGRIEKASLGAIFSTNEPRGQRRSGVGVLKNDYFGNDKYDYSMSPEIPEDGGHWSSRDPYTGLLLKSKYHPTINKEYKESKRLGLKLYEDRNGRQYTLEEWQVNMPEYILKGLKEIDYPTLPPNPFDDRIGKYMDGHTKEKEYESYLPYSGMIKSIAKEFGLPEHLLIHLASTESHFDHNALNTETGASGLMQIMPESMAKYKSDGLWRDDLSDAENNIRAGAHILKYFYGVYKDWKKAFMAYKGIAKDKRVPTHPEHDYLIKKNKIDYLMSYVD